MNVKAINYTDEKRMLKELKDNGQDEIVNYIRALKSTIEGNNYVRDSAIKKIRELSSEIEQLKENNNE